MMKSNILKVLCGISIFALAACSTEAEKKQIQKSSGWTIKSNQSLLNFSSTKNGDIEEKHEFNGITGSVSKTGEVQVTVDLTSVDTNIPIRDERLQKHVFNTEQHPKALITANIDPQLLSVKDKTKTTIEGTLSLAGQSTDFSAEISVTPAKGMLIVTTEEPVVLSAKKLGVADGVEKLREIAGLNSISDEVPVTFSLTLLHHY